MDKKRKKEKDNKTKNKNIENRKTQQSKKCMLE